MPNWGDAQLGRCLGGDAQGEMPRGACPGGDAMGEMPRGRCTGGDAQGEMPRGRCPGGAAGGEYPREPLGPIGAASLAVKPYINEVKSCHRKQPPALRLCHSTTISHRVNIGS